MDDAGQAPEVASKEAEQWPQVENDASFVPSDKRDERTKRPIPM